MRQRSPTTFAWHLSALPLAPFHLAACLAGCSCYACAKPQSCTHTVGMQCIQAGDYHSGTERSRAWLLIPCCWTR